MDVIHARPSRPVGRWGRSQMHCVRLSTTDADLLARAATALGRSKTALLEEGLHLVAQKYRVPVQAAGTSQETSPE